MILEKVGLKQKKCHGNKNALALNCLSVSASTKKKFFKTILQKLGFKQKRCHGNRNAIPLSENVFKFNW